MAAYPCASRSLVVLRSYRGQADSAVCKKLFKYEFNNLDEQPFYVWAAARSFEQFIPMKRLFDETGDEMINQLVDKIVDGSYDWFSVYEKFRYKKPASTYLSRGIINFGAKVGANADKKRKYGAMPQKNR